MTGWVVGGPEPHLVGQRCNHCGTSHFPPTVVSCRNPACQGSDLTDVALSRFGLLWSYTVNRFPPPPPYRASDPFTPYGIAAVELVEEGITVLGKLARDFDVETLRRGTLMELTDEDDDDGWGWRWRPVEGSTTGSSYA